MSEAIQQVRAAVTPDEHRPSPRTISFYRVITPVSWIVSVIVATVYTFSRPHDESGDDRHSIWRQNSHHKTPFSLNAIITSLYWMFVWLLQIPYLFNLYTPASLTTPALILAPYHTLSNAFSIAFIAFWTRGFFWWALVVAVLNFFTLTFAYFRYHKAPALMHFAVLAAPLSFAFVTLFWDGAVAFHGHRYAVAARIIANVFVWSWAVYGGFYLVVFRDWAMAFCLSILACSLGVAQFFLAVFALQWIFAFTIMALLFIASLAVAFPSAAGVTFGRRDEAERAPLIAEDPAV